MAPNGVARPPSGKPSRVLSATAVSLVNSNRKPAQNTNNEDAAPQQSTNVDGVVDNQDNLADKAILDQEL